MGLIAASYFEANSSGDALLHSPTSASSQSLISRQPSQWLFSRKVSTTYLMYTFCRSCLNVCLPTWTYAVAENWATIPNPRTILASAKRDINEDTDCASDLAKSNRRCFRKCEWCLVSLQTDVYHAVSPITRPVVMREHLAYAIVVLPVSYKQNKVSSSTDSEATSQ